MEIYTLAYDDHYIVYRPLLRLAFAANAALVNWIATMEDTVPTPCNDHESACYRFLERVGFFQPDPAPPEPDESMAPWRPTCAVLCLTNQCNLRCVYCYASAGEQKPRTLSPAMGKNVIDAVCSNAIQADAASFSISFHGGGEPTLASDVLRELAQYANASPLPVNLSLTTNGCWSHAASDWMLDTFQEFTISCDGLPAVQNRQRPQVSRKGSFRRVMTTIHALDRAGSRYGVRLTATDQSIAHLAESIEFLCRETQCRVFQVEPSFSQGRADRNQAVLSRFDPFIEAFLDAYDIAASHGRHLYYSGARPWLITSMFCQSPYASVVVTPDGDLSTCFEVIDPAHPLYQTFFMGNLSTDSPVIRDHSARHRLLADIENHRQQCRHCFCYWHCAGDCPAKRLSAHAPLISAADGRCYLNRTITKALIARYMAAGGGIWVGSVNEAAV